MNLSGPDSRFSTDRRAVSAVIGFILLFGILMLALTTYQAQVVPEQNAQAEFNHFETSQNELTKFRNAVMRAGRSDISQFPSITLGMTYQTRLFTINPPPPTGTLQTSEPYNITISNGTEAFDKNVSTRFIEYQPGYQEISVGPTRFEHSVLYLDERAQDNGVSIIEEQHLVKDGTVRITAVQNAFQETGTGRATVELYPQEELNTTGFPDPDGGNLTVTIPTRLDEDEYWDDALADASGIYQGVDSDPDGIDKLNLTVNSTDLEVDTVGIDQEPDEGPAKNSLAQAGGGVGGGGGGSVTDDGSLSFDGLPTATSTGSGNDVNEIEFDFDISNPDNVNYQILLGVRNQDGDSTERGPLTKPSSPQTVTGPDALPNQINMADQYLDVEIILRNEDGSVVDTRAGRINSRDETISLS